MSAGEEEWYHAQFTKKDEQLTQAQLRIKELKGQLISALDKSMHPPITFNPALMVERDRYKEALEDIETGLVKKDVLEMLDTDEVTVDVSYLSALQIAREALYPKDGE